MTMRTPSGLTLITGGCRSGKSRYALELANRFSGSKLYLATAEAGDPEMRQRIENHQKERGSSWSTVESPYHPEITLNDPEERYSVILLDCITFWTSNLMLRQEPDHFILEKAHYLASASREASCPVILVTNEVGLGTPPTTMLGRSFEQLSGEVNRILSRSADRVIHLVAGIPREIKNSARANVRRFKKEYAGGTHYQPL